MHEIVTVVLSLICLMVANIIMGKKLADFKDEYNKEKLVNGISKAGFSLLGLSLVYISTLIYPMNVAKVNGQIVTTLSGATILLKASNVLYGCKVLVKIKNLLTVNIPVNLLEEDTTKNVTKDK